MNSPRVLLVTGGSRGIGAAIVRLAVEHGYDVCFSYVDQAAAAQGLVEWLRSVRADARLLALQADVADPQAVRALFERCVQEFGALDALVNNAGITGRLGPFRDTTVETMRRVLDVNVLGTMLCAQHAVRHWQDRRSAGCLVNVSSVAATLGSPHEYVHYAGAKGAVDSFSVGLAKEVAADGIRVNVVSPGPALTEIHAAAGEPDRPARVAARIPMGRPGTPEEIAQAVLWLLSDQASYVTGSILKVAGGL